MAILGASVLLMGVVYGFWSPVRVGSTECGSAFIQDNSDVKAGLEAARRLQDKGMSEAATEATELSFDVFRLCNQRRSDRSRTLLMLGILPVGMLVAAGVLWADPNGQPRYRRR